MKKSIEIFIYIGSMDSVCVCCVFVCTVGKHTSTAKRGGMLSSSSPSLFTIRERTNKKRWNYLVSLNNGVFILWRLNSVAHNNPLGSHSRPISFNPRLAHCVCVCYTRISTINSRRQNFSTMSKMSISTELKMCNSMVNGMECCKQ